VAHKPRSATPLIVGVFGALAAAYAGGRLLLERRGGPVLAAEDAARPGTDEGEASPVSAARDATPSDSGHPAPENR
jgi:hypothetical protein